MYCIKNFGSPFQAKELAWLPNIVMAIISVIAGISVLFLPETVKFPLPQTLGDIYSFYGEDLEGSTDQEGTTVPLRKRKWSISAGTYMDDNKGI